MSTATQPSAAQLRAAVIKYKPLHIAGGDEAAVKAEIAKDQRWDETGVNIIYAAVLAAKEPEPAASGKGEEGDGDASKSAPAAKNKGVYVVKKPFRDISNFEHQWNAGTDVSHLDAVRLEGLVEKGLVEQTK